MSVRLYHISRNEQQLGPWSMDQVMEKLGLGELEVTDHIYDVNIEEWQLIVENKDYVNRIKGQQTKSIPKPKEDKKEDSISEERLASDSVKATDFTTLNDNPMLTEWFVLKGENKFGPFQYTEVIKMLQEKVVFEFDFAWKNSFKNWQRIAEIQEFNPKNIKRLQQGLMPEIKNVFFRRNHPRISYNGLVIIHDNQNVWKGKSQELSEGGAGIIMDNSMIIPGQNLYMHFKPQVEVPAFNAICEVVSKKYIDDIKEKHAPVSYGVKFINVNDNTHKLLKKFTSTKGNSAA